MQAEEARRLTQLEKENARLKKILTEGASASQACTCSGRARVGVAAALARPFGC